MLAWVTAPRRRCALLLLTLLVCVSLLLGDGIFLAACKAFQQQQHRYHVTSSNHLLVPGAEKDITRGIIENLGYAEQESKDSLTVDRVLPVPVPQLPSSTRSKPGVPSTAAPRRTSQARGKGVIASRSKNSNKVVIRKSKLPNVTKSTSLVPTAKKTFPKVGAFIKSLKFVLNHEETCGKDAGASLPLLIIVTTGVTKFDARDALRTTWGGYARDLGAKMVFLLGRTDTQDVQDQVQDENSVYKDIIQADFTDCYMNMTLKTVAMMKWVSEHCSKVRFVLKTDDDMFINVDLLLSYVALKKNATKTIIGKVAKGWKPHRDQRNKWYVSPEQFSGTQYPPFTTGPAYLFTGDSAGPLYEASLKHTFFYLEDVLVTGIVAQNVSVKRIHQPAMRNRPQKVTFCSYRHMMTSHKHTPDEIEDLWEEVNQSGIVCKPKKPASDAFLPGVNSSNETMAEEKK